MARRRRTSLALPGVGLPGLPRPTGGDFGTIQLLQMLSRQAGGSIEPDLLLAIDKAGAAGAVLDVNLLLPAKTSVLVKKVYVFKNDGTASRVSALLAFRDEVNEVIGESLATGDTGTALWDRLHGLILSNRNSFGGVVGLRFRSAGVAVQTQRLILAVVVTPMVYVAGGTEGNTTVAGGTSSILLV